MTLVECYSTLGNYEDTIKRLVRESIIKKYVINFLSDKRYEDLKVAITAEQFEEAMNIAHALKGVCMTLGFAKLTASVSELFDALRNNADRERISELFSTVTDDYDMTISVITEFKESEEKKV